MAGVVRCRRMARVTRPPPFTRCTPSSGHSRSMTACVTTPANAAPMNTRSATSGRASTARRSHPGQPRDLPAAPTNTRSAPSGHASSTRRGHSRKPCRRCPSTTRTARRPATRHASPPSDDLVVRSERLLSDAAPPPVTWSDGRQRRRTLRHPAPPANLVHIRNVRPPSRTASPCAVLCHIGDLRPRSRRRPPSRMWTKIADGYRPAAPRRRA